MERLRKRINLALCAVILVGTLGTFAYLVVTRPEPAQVVRTEPIPEVEVGDILALFDTGAYQEVSMSNFNAIPRPATVLVTGDRAAVIRQRETQEDVFRRDVIPEHLLR